MSDNKEYVDKFMWEWTFSKHFVTIRCEILLFMILSAQVGVGLKFRVDKSDTAIVRDIVADGPADGSDIRLGGTFSLFFLLFFSEVHPALLCAYSFSPCIRKTCLGPYGCAYRRIPISSNAK